MHKHIKVYKDVWRTKYVKRIKLHMHVTRIQPIIHIHKVTRHHTRLVGVVDPVRNTQDGVSAAPEYVTNSHVYLRPGVLAVAAATANID